MLLNRSCVNGCKQNAIAESRNLVLIPPMQWHNLRWRGSLVLLSLLHLWSARAETFRVATYNVENYLDKPTDTRPAKPEEGKAKVFENIVLLKPDVLALQ